MLGVGIDKIPLHPLNFSLITFNDRFSVISKLDVLELSEKSQFSSFIYNVTTALLVAKF